MAVSDESGSDSQVKPGCCALGWRGFLEDWASSEPMLPYQQLLAVNAAREKADGRQAVLRPRVVKTYPPRSDLKQQAAVQEGR